MTKQLYQTEAKLSGVLLDNLSAESSTASIRIRWFDSDDKATARTPHASTLKYTIDPENTQGKKSEFFKSASHSTSSGVTTHLTNTRGLQRDQTTDLSGSATRAQSWDAGTPVSVTTEPHNMNLVKEYFEGSEPVPGDMEFSGDPTFSGAPTFEGAVTFVEQVDVSGGGFKFPQVVDETARDTLYPTPTGGETADVAGDLQRYNGTTVQWESFDVGTPTPNGSEAVTGKFQYNTAAQTTAATDTDGGDPTVNKPSETARVIQDNSYIYAASTTGNDTYLATFTPTPGTIGNGRRALVKVDTANTGACSLNGVAIKTKAGNDPATGDIPANSIMDLIYNSTGPKWELQGAYGNAPLTSADITKKIGSGTLNITGNGANNIAHGLGRTPSLVTFNYATTTGATDVGDWSMGTILYDGTTTAALTEWGVLVSTLNHSVSTGAVQVYVNGTKQFDMTLTVTSTNIVITVANYAASEDVAYTFRVE